MSDATHAPRESQPRTLIPGYARLLDAVANTCAVGVQSTPRPTIVNLGAGTGALAARCLAAVPAATLVGVEVDADALGRAMKRFARSRGPVTLIHADPLTMTLPQGDAVVAALTLNRLEPGRTKAACFKRVFKALPHGGVLVSGDFHPSAVAAVATSQMAGWIAHMRQSRTEAAVRGLLEAWDAEASFTTLEEELGLLQHAGFAVDVTWRHRGFAVVVAVKP
jgi:SAM-dependent methyltransferase